MQKESQIKNLISVLKRFDRQQKQTSKSKKTIKSSNIAMVKTKISNIKQVKYKETESTLFGVNKQSVVFSPRKDNYEHLSYVKRQRVPGQGTGKVNKNVSQFNSNEKNYLSLPNKKEDKNEKRPIPKLQEINWFKNKLQRQRKVKTEEVQAGTQNKVNISLYTLCSLGNYHQSYIPISPPQTKNNKFRKYCEQIYKKHEKKSKQFDLYPLLYGQSNRQYNNSEMRSPSPNKQDDKINSIDGSMNNFSHKFKRIDLYSNLKSKYSNIVIQKLIDEPGGPNKIFTEEEFQRQKTNRNEKGFSLKTENQKFDLFISHSRDFTQEKRSIRQSKQRYRLNNLKRNIYHKSKLKTEDMSDFYEYDMKIEGWQVTSKDRSQQQNERNMGSRSTSIQGL